MNIIRQCTHRDLDQVVVPTVAAFAPLLKSNRSLIKQTPVRSFRYTSSRDTRADLDIYYPTSAHTPTSPVLFFIYGGGFNSGEKSISPNSFALVYANLASFFSRHGYISVIPDYRLVPHVTFPTPAHDILDALRFVQQSPESLISDSSPFPDTNNILILGHSAGAAHIATILFSTDVLPIHDPLRSHIKAVVLQSPPYDLSAMNPDWPSAHVHAQYWTSLEIAKQNDPLHLFKKLDSNSLATLPPILMVQGEFEPDWLIDAANVFHKQVKESTGQLLPILIAKGHNHISMNWALSTGEGEEWAKEVLLWFDNVLKNR